LRLVRTKDTDELNYLVDLMLPDTPDDNLREVVQGTWWLAKVGSDVVGCCGVRALRRYSHEPGWEHTAFMTRAVVLPQAQGKGYQRRMIRVRVSWAKRNGYNRIVTYVAVGNVPSHRNLVREGFLPYNPQAHWAGDGVVYLEKRLDS
jgi:GNAT superfamily N-acetyltransferase